MSTATISFVCNAIGCVQANIVFDPGCSATAQRNALAIERALNGAEEAIRERSRR